MRSSSPTRSGSKRLVGRRHDARQPRHRQSELTRCSSNKPGSRPAQVLVPITPDTEGGLSPRSFMGGPHCDCGRSWCVSVRSRVRGIMITAQSVGPIQETPLVSCTKLLCLCRFLRGGLALGLMVDVSRLVLSGAQRHDTARQSVQMRTTEGWGGVLCSSVSFLLMRQY